MLRLNIQRIVRPLWERRYYHCEFCQLPKLCIGNEFLVKKEEIEIRKINPCIECRFFKMNKKKGYGVCKKYKSIETGENMDVISTRYYADLCAPCGREFVKK